MSIETPVSTARDQMLSDIIDRSRSAGHQIQRVYETLAAVVHRLRQRELLARLEVVVRRTLHWIPLTATGWVAIPVLTWLLLEFGIARQDRILLGLTSTGLAVITLLMTSTLAAALWLKFRADSPAPDSISCESGTTVRTGFELPVLGLIPTLDVHVKWFRSRPAGGSSSSGIDCEVTLTEQHGGLVEQVRATRRGRFDSVVRQLRVGDAFGLTRVVFSQGSPADVTVWPRMARAGRIAPWHQYRAGDDVPDPDATPDGDLIEQRDYAPGDPLKRVCWKKYARTGRLVVRMPERAQEPCDQIAVTTVSATADEPSAVLARSMFQHGSVAGRLLYCADGEAEVTTDPYEAEAQLIRSAAAIDRPATGFDRLRQHADVSSCLLFVPHREGPWLDAVSSRLAACEYPCRVIIGIDGGVQTEAPHWRQWITRKSNDSVTHADEVRLIRRRLQATGAQVHVIDCESGDELPL